MNGLRERLLEPRRLGEMAPMTRFFVYGFLAVWAFLVLFPLYWLAVTSLKLPIHVSDGPVYVPFVDFAPSLHAWRYIFFDLGNDTFRPYMNSVVVAVVSTLFAVTTGATAAYALSRLTFRPRLLSVGLFLAVLALSVTGVVQLGVDWRIGLAVGVALFFLVLRAFARTPSLRLSNGDILFWIISQRILPPVVAAIPIYVMFQTWRYGDGERPVQP
jgi:multiple sugar transport system permease protein